MWGGERVLATRRPFGVGVRRGIRSASAIGGRGPGHRRGGRRDRARRSRCGRSDRAARRRHGALRRHDRLRGRDSRHDSSPAQDHRNRSHRACRRRRAWRAEPRRQRRRAPAWALLRARSREPADLDDRRERRDQRRRGACAPISFDVHRPIDAGALYLVEVEGLVEETGSWEAAIGRVLMQYGATDVRSAKSVEERELLWKARKLGYAALARIKPNNYLHDAVVPRSRLPEVLRDVNAIAARYGYVIANMFHIGDGNLHPVLLFDAREEPIERVMEASAEILKLAIDAGGALSGEHGIGLEKNHFMFWVFGPADLEAQRRARDAFDPDGMMNPGKVFPGGDACADLPTERAKRALAEGMWV